MYNPLRLSPGLLKHSGTSGLSTSQNGKSVVTLVCIDCAQIPAFPSPLPHHSAGPMGQGPYTPPQSTAQPHTAQTPGTATSFDSVPRGKRC